MSQPKVCGIETEYGIFVRGDDVSPMSASSMLVRAFSSSGPTLNGWDFEDESPHIDSRTGGTSSNDFPLVETAMANSVLTNGARYYVDHAHPEFSTPECRTPREALIYDLAGEEIIRQSMDRVNAQLREGVELRVHKNNSDGKGNSYGCHENYLVDREVRFGDLCVAMTTHFVTRQVFTGAGKVGVENPREGEHRPGFQLSQRADFFEEDVGLETTVRRPIINTRDEPHCDPTRWRRLHVIAGDANMSQSATFVKLGTTALLLAMLEDRLFPLDLRIKDPVGEIRRVSHDPSLRHLVELEDGRRMSALDVQIVLCEATQHWLERVDEDPTGGDADSIMGLWSEMLEGLERDPLSVSHLIDWVAKKKIVDGLMSRHGIGAEHLRVRAVDLQYHDMDRARSLAERVGLARLIDDRVVADCIFDPPDSTRAFFRGECVRRWSRDISSANWDSIVFNAPDGQLRRVAMMDPLKGTKQHVSGILEEVTTVAELLAVLGDDAVETVAADPGW